jgi:hypothetical protein
MQQLLAVLIAAVLTVLALFPVARRYLRQPSVWMLVVVGVFAFPIAQWVNRTIWDPLAAQFGVPDVGWGMVLNLLVWALLTEGFKFAPVAIVGAFSDVPARDWYALGAAAGAGFGFFAVQQVIAFALEVSRLSVGTPGSAALAIFCRFFHILAHVATTTFVARAVPRGRLWGAFLAAAAAQVVLGLVEQGQGTLGPILGNLLFSLIALLLYLYVWTLRDRIPGPQPVGGVARAAHRGRLF